MRIGEVARQAGVEASAVRYYEAAGILPKPERVSGRRSYQPEVLDLLRLVQFARGVGLSIREVRTLFGNGIQGGRISERWRKLARAKIDSIEEQMTQLRGAQKMLKKVLKCGCVDPLECGRELQAHAPIDRD